MYLYSWLVQSSAYGQGRARSFYGKYNGLFCACANSVYQASPRGEGGEGPGDEASGMLAGRRALREGPGDAASGVLAGRRALTIK